MSIRLTGVMSSNVSQQLVSVGLHIILARERKLTESSCINAYVKGSVSASGTGRIRL